MNRRHWLGVAALLGLQAVLVGWNARRQSPCFDEVGHFVAGLHSWQTGEIDMDRVNPPLVRMMATALLAPQFPTIRSSVGESSGRPEFFVGPAVVRELGGDTHRLSAIARICCLPCSLIGGIVCCLSTPFMATGRFPAQPCLSRPSRG